MDNYLKVTSVNTNLATAAIGAVHKVRHARGA